MKKPKKKTSHRLKREIARDRLYGAYIRQQKQPSEHTERVTYNILVSGNHSHFLQKFWKYTYTDTMENENEPNYGFMPCIEISLCYFSKQTQTCFLL